MKRLLILLLTCCVFALSGCGGEGNTSAGTEESHDPLVGVEVNDGKSIKDKQLEENFHLVCEQIGIDPEKIQEIRYIIDIETGNHYEFAYDDMLWVLRYDDKSTVESVHLGRSLKVFDKVEGTYHIDDFKIDDHIQSCVEALTQDNLKAAFGLGEDESLNFAEWYVERDTSLYHSFGYLSMKNDAGEEENLYFSMSFENCPDEEMIYLRFFIIENDVPLDEMAKANIPERVPSVEPTASK